MNAEGALGGYLQRLEWSPERLAREVDRVCGHGTISAKAPYGWLQGSCPRGRLPHVVAQILAVRLGEPITAAMLWPHKIASGAVDLAADFGLNLPWTQDGTWQVASLLTAGWANHDPAMLHVVTGHALISQAVDWVVADDTTFRGRQPGEQITPAAVEVLSERVAQLRRLDDEQGGTLVLDWVTRDLAWAAGLVRNGSYDLPTGMRLHQVVAELAQLAGWMATDLGQHARAQRYLLLGLRAAHTAKDRLLGANIVSCLSYQAAWTGAHREALRLIQVARKAAPGPHAGSAQALLATRQGRAHAQLHQADDCRRALDEAAEIGQHADAAMDPPWSYWVTPAVLAADAGRAWLEFGRPDLAEENLLRGLKLFGDSQPRNRMLHCMSLAEARLACGNLEGAAEAAHPALDLICRFDSRRARIRLRAVAEGFARFDGAAARDVADRIDTVLSA